MEEKENQPDSSAKAPKKFNKVNLSILLILLGSLLLLGGIISNALLTKPYFSAGYPLIFSLLLALFSVLGLAICAGGAIALLLVHSIGSNNTATNNIIYKTSLIEGLEIIFWLTMFAAAILLPNNQGVFNRGAENWDGLFYYFEWFILAIISLLLFIISFIAEILALVNKWRANAAKENENRALYKLHPIMFCSFILKIVFIIIFTPFSLPYI